MAQDQYRAVRGDVSSLAVPGGAHEADIEKFSATSLRRVRSRTSSSRKSPALRREFVVSSL